MNSNTFMKIIILMNSIFRYSYCIQFILRTKTKHQQKPGSRCCRFHLLASQIRGWRGVPSSRPRRRS